MVMRPEDIEQREFGSALRGFDKAEVRAFLRRVAAEVRYLEGEVAAGPSPTSPPVAAPAPESPLSERLGVEPTSPAPDATAGAVPAPPVAPATIAVPPAPPAPTLGAIAADTDLSPDRFAALGDRIANLLRNAQDTAEQVRAQADADAAASRDAADAYAVDTRSAADAYALDVRNQADAALAQAQAEAAQIRDHAAADAAETRAMSTSELDTARQQAADVRSSAEIEAQELRTRTIADAEASMAGRAAVIAEQEALVAAERERAMAELADARGQVATLLQEARAQSEFIRQESEEIIRTKVRANMEQAQRRIDILRTTETASKDRIAAARRELEGALAKLEAEPVPGLAEGTEHEVLAEAQARVTEIAPPAPPAPPTPPTAPAAGAVWFDDPLEGLIPDSSDDSPSPVEIVDVVEVVEVVEFDPATGATRYEAEYVETEFVVEAPPADIAPPAAPTWSDPEPASDDPSAPPVAGSVEELADVHTPENEDALAKLVREAMQRAVDTARGNDA